MTPDRSGNIIVLSSPSGGGKTSIYKSVLNRMKGTAYSISYTTRAPRGNEIHGKDYYFVDVDEFKKMIDKSMFAEWAEVHGHYYGTSREKLQVSLNKGLDVLLDIDVQGAIQIKKSIPQGVFIFIFPPSMKVLEERLRARQSESDDEIQQRLHIARKEMDHFRHYDYVITNDILEQAIEDVCCIIKAERQKTERLDQQALVSRYML